jgi:hypothetical protein
LFEPSLIFLARRRQLPKQCNNLTIASEPAPGDVVNGFNQTHDADNWRWIDAFAESLVVEAHIAARHGSFENPGRFGHAVNDFTELPHDFGLLRVAKIEAVGCRQRQRSNTNQVPATFGHSNLGTTLGVPPTIAAIAIQAHRQRFVGSLDANHGSVAARQLHSVGPHHVVILVIDPFLGAKIRRGKKLSKHWAAGQSGRRRLRERCGDRDGRRLP